MGMRGSGLKKAITKAEAAKLTDAQRLRAFEKEEENRVRRERESKPNPIKEAEKKRAAHAAKLRAEQRREKLAQARAEEATKPGYVAPKIGRPFGAVGGYIKPWMKKILGNFYTDTDLIRDFIMVCPEKRVQILQELDPKTFGEGSPEEIATRIKAALDAIQKSVPAPK